MKEITWLALLLGFLMITPIVLLLVIFQIKTDVCREAGMRINGNQECYVIKDGRVITYQVTPTSLWGFQYKVNKYPSIPD